MPHIPLSVPNLKGRELKYLTEAVRDEWVSTAGPFVAGFERAVAEYVGVPNAVACQSGTAGLHLALLESGAKPGEIVVTTDLTFIASVNPIRYCGCEPVFIDCDDRLCLDPQKLRDYCETECERRAGGLYERQSGRRIAAVTVVHIFGNLADMEPIADCCDEFGLFLIEDACEALGSRWTSGRYCGRHAGTVGDIGVFSFNGNKIITTGGGGMIVAKDPQKLAHMAYSSQQSKDDPVRFVHNEIGYNYRLTNLQAALGIAQMEQLDGFVAAKKRNYELYNRLGLDLLPFAEGVAPNYWFYSYMSGGRREYLMAGLKERGIDSRPIWELMHRLKPYEGARTYRLEKAIYYRDNILNLPCSTNLTDCEVEAVAKAVKELMVL